MPIDCPYVHCPLCCEFLSQNRFQFEVDVVLQIADPIDQIFSRGLGRLKIQTIGHER